MKSLIKNLWIYATMRIETDWGESGTGFVVSRIDGDKRRFFLVTNKHVLVKSAEDRVPVEYVNLYFNVADEETGDVGGEFFQLPLIKDGVPIWKEHRDPGVDVLAIEVTSVYEKVAHLRTVSAEYSEFVNADTMDAWEIGYADDVLVVGYPDIGIKHANTNFPLVRKGVIASHIGELLYLDEPRPGGSHEFRGFLVDGGIVRGSSGSPVVLKPESGRIVGGGMIMGISPAVLLGIVVETTHAKLSDGKHETIAFADIGLVHDAETVKETVELFFST